MFRKVHGKGRFIVIYTLRKSGTDEVNQAVIMLLPLIGNVLLHNNVPGFSRSERSSFKERHICGWHVACLASPQ